MIEPSAVDIAQDRTYFYAVWSPGQYAVPGVLIDAGMSAGAAVMTVSVLASIIGLGGWWWLFTALHFPANMAMAACLLIAASRSFNYSFLAYVGSDVLAFALFPFLAAASVKLRASLWLLPFATLAMGVAFFAKNSLPIYFGSWLVANAAVSVSETGARRAAMVYGPALAGAAASLLLIHWSYTSRGWTPVSYEPIVSFRLHDYLLPWAMPLLAATSWDDVLSRLFAHPSAPLLAFDYKQSLLLLGAVAAISAGGALAVVRNRDAHGIRAAAFSAIVLAVFTGLLATGSGASLDLSRHYRIVGYVWLPSILQFVSRRQGVAGALVAAMLWLPCAYGLASCAANWRRHLRQSGSHSAGLRITHLDSSPRVVSLLTLLDREMQPNSLVVTSNPAHALEFERTRVLATSVVSDPIDAIRSSPRLGVVENLVLIADVAGMSEAKQQEWLRSFESFREWQAIDVDTHRFYVPVGQPVDLPWLRTRVEQLAF